MESSIFKSCLLFFVRHGERLDDVKPKLGYKAPFIEFAFDP